MKANVFGIGLLFVAATHGADITASRPEERINLRLAGVELSRFPLAIGEENAKAPVRLMERLKSDVIRDLFPNQTIYRMVATKDPLHNASFSALLLGTNGVPTHLASDKDVAGFLGDLTTGM